MWCDKKKRVEARSSPGAVDTPTDSLQQKEKKGCVCVCVWREVGMVNLRGSPRVGVESCGAARHMSAEWRGGHTVRGPPPRRGRGQKGAGECVV